jgi:hypothetical protein
MKDKVLVFIGVILGVVILGGVLSLIFFNLTKSSQQVTYQCEIDNTKSSMTSIDCTSNADCNIAGLMCDTSSYKCVIVPSGKVTDNNGNDVAPRYTYINTPSKKECDEINGFWKAEIK